MKLGVNIMQVAKKIFCGSKWMTCLGKQDIKERALPKSPSKPKSTTIKKKTNDMGNNYNTVTLEMHNNLKNTINKMDDETIQFAKQYEEEQASIATEISKIWKLLLLQLQVKM